VYLHDKNLIHRDLSLSNVLVDERLHVKLIDFGLSVPVGSSVVRGRVGTPSYMAPEMIRKWQHTESADIYSFGVLSYELITGKKAFKGELREQRMTYNLNVNPLPPSRLGLYCSPELEPLVMKMLSKDPAQRAKSAREVEGALFLMRHRRGLE
jgi:serine/threonine-protein kinase